MPMVPVQGNPLHRTGRALHLAAPPFNSGKRSKWKPAIQEPAPKWHTVAGYLPGPMPTTATCYPRTIPSRLTNHRHAGAGGRGAGRRSDT